MSQKSALNLTRTFLQNFLREIRLKKMEDELNASQRLELETKGKTLKNVSFYISLKVMKHIYFIDLRRKKILYKHVRLN